MASEWRILYPVILSFTFIVIIIKAKSLTKEEGFQSVPAKSEKEGIDKCKGISSDPREQLRCIAEDIRARSAATEGFSGGITDDTIDPILVIKGIQDTIAEISKVKEGMTMEEGVNEREKKEGEMREMTAFFKSIVESGFKKSQIKEGFLTVSQAYRCISDNTVLTCIINTILGGIQRAAGGEQRGTYTTQPYTQVSQPNTNRTVPTYLTNITIPPAAGKRPEDAAYDAYQEVQDAPPVIKRQETITIEKEVVPDYGATIGYFDANISDIPWDMDNRTYRVDDALWGYVSENTSKAIFMKNYYRNLLGTPTNLIEDASTGEMVYFSPILPVAASADESTILAATILDNLVPIVGNLGLDKFLFDPIERGLENFTSRLSVSTGMLRGFIFDQYDMINGVSVKRATSRILTPSEFTERMGFKTKTDTNIRLTGERRSELKTLGDIDTKLKVGAASSRGLIQKLKDRVTKAIARRIAKFSFKIAARKLAAITLAGSLAGLGWVLAILTGGVLSVIAGFFSLLTIVISAVFGILDMIVSVVEQLLTPLFDQIFQPQGVCKPGQNTLESIVGDDLFYFLEMFCPIGSVFTILNNYLCFGNGSGELKKPLREQPYLKDSTLSIYFHQWPADQVPRGTKTKKTMTFNPNLSSDCLGKWCFTNCSSGRPAFPYAPFCVVDTLIVGTWPSAIRNVNEQSIITTFDPGYQPPDITTLTFPWCNYASPEMMDRMAQFYYNMAWQNAFIADYKTGAIEISRIEKIYGVVASSEFSCDIACDLVRYQFHPITGEHFARLPKDPDDKTGETSTYLRFYFVAGNAGPNGLFTVTGCTHYDYTGVDAMGSTFSAAKEGREFVPSVPKTFEITTLDNPQVNWSNARNNWKSILARSAIGVGTFAVGAKIGGGSAVGGAIGQTGAGQISAQLEPTLQRMEEQANQNPGAGGNGDAFIRGSKADGKFVLMTETRDFVINRGAVKELSVGFVPAIEFCKDLIIPNTQCVNKISLRQAINKYHAENPTKRVKEVSEIEARGRNACYYKWRETAYDPATNIEARETTENEALLTFRTTDTLTCRFAPDSFTTDFNRYPVRTICENMPQASIYNPKPDQTNVTIPAGQATVPSSRGPVPVTMTGTNMRYLTRKVVTNLEGVVSYVPSYPLNPFVVPRELAASTTLGGAACPNSHCNNADQIELLVNDFNAAHTDKKILKVTKAWTPKTDRCDYEVFMQRKLGAAKPVASKETLQMTVRPSATNQCLFTRVSDGSDALNSGTFIIDSTPLLSQKIYNIAGKDVSGQDFNPVKGMFDGIKGFFAETLTPLFKIDYKKEVLEPAKAVEVSLQETQRVVAQNLPFKTCPQKKCSDPDVLLAMMTTYNTAMAPKQISGGEGNTMKRVLRAAISGPDSCDLMFENVFELFDDVLYPPLESYVDTKVYRFKLTSTPGNCSAPFRVSTDKDAIQDISGSSLFIPYETATLDSPYALPIGRVFDCRTPDFMREVKRQLELKNTDGNLNVFKAVTLSFQRGNEQCEYKMYKDLTYIDDRTGELIEETNVETYVRVDVSYNPNTQVANILKIEEFESATVDYEFDAKTGDYIYKIGNQVITMPLLFAYDEADPSDRINSNVFLF